jgi:hypothetical protein
MLLKREMAEALAKKTFTKLMDKQSHVSLAARFYSASDGKINFYLCLESFLSLDTTSLN